MAGRRLSIAALLIAALLAVVTLVLAVFAAVAYRHEAGDERERLQQALRSRADELAVALALPMWNVDDAQLRSIVRSAMQDPTVAAIDARTPDQQYAMVRDEQWQPVEVPEAVAADGPLLLQREVRHAGETIGRLRVAVTERFVEIELAEWRRTALLFIVVLDGVIVLSLAALLWVLMLRPVRALDRHAAALTAGAAPVEAGGVRFFGELAALRASIGTMVGMLESRVRALRESEERLQLAADAASMGVWDWDIVAGRVAWDAQIRSIYGLGPDEHGGPLTAWSDKIVPEDRARTAAAVDAALRGEREYACEFAIRRSDGSVRVIKAAGITTRDANGSAVRMVGVNHDITEQRAAEAQVRTLNAELERRVEERTAQLTEAIDEVLRSRDIAESATRAKSEFLANMSHEIRTPMNAVLGMTELALRGELSAQQRDYLGKAKAAGESLLGILNDVLDFSKIEAGKLEIEHRPFALAAVMRRVEAVAGLRAQDKGLPLRFEFAAAVPPQLVGDALRLEQVLLNLCTNAVKFTARGEVVVSAELLEPAAGAGGALLRFAVRDTGIGMTHEQVAGLFEPFNQGDASTTRHYGGTGLGLAICRRLVGLMGGEIGASSLPGVGSSFSFTLRCGVAAAASGTAAADEARAASGDDGALLALLRGRRVLLVEDNELNQIVAAHLLRDACAMQVTVASDGVQALAALATDRFDAVLLDVQMPGMDGYEVARRIRAQPPLQALPVIAMTAHAMARERANCLAAGMNDFVSKPFDPHDLFAVLARWIGASRPAAAPAATAPVLGSGVDFALGLRRCLGQQALYARIVGRYVLTRSDTPQAMRDALAAGRHTDAARMAHSLISTAGTLGAMALSEQARVLQAAIDAGDSAAWPTLIDALEAEHRSVGAALAGYLAEPAVAPV